MPGIIASRYSFAEIPNRRHDSTAERIAATFGPDAWLPACSQFFLSSATGRIEFSAKLFDNSTSEFFPHIQRVADRLSARAFRQRFVDQRQTLLAYLLQPWFGMLAPQRLTLLSVHPLLACFPIHQKQRVHPRDHLHRVYELPPA